MGANTLNQPAPSPNASKANAYLRTRVMTASQEELRPQNRTERLSATGY